MYMLISTLVYSKCVCLHKWLIWYFSYGMVPPYKSLYMYCSIYWVWPPPRMPVANERSCFSTCLPFVVPLNNLQLYITWRGCFKQPAAIDLWPGCYWKWRFGKDTLWKMNGWNLKITCLKRREIIFQNIPNLYFDVNFRVYSIFLSNYGYFGYLCYMWASWLVLHDISMTIRGEWGRQPAF